jgi:hypothetical protein
MRVLRIILAIPCFFVGVYLAGVSLLVGCAQAAESPGNAAFYVITGLPPSIGTFVIGIVGMVLIGLGYALIATPERHR